MNCVVDTHIPFVHNEVMAKILLVEDEDFIRQLYKRQFEKAGYTIEDFASGKD